MNNEEYEEFEEMALECERFFWYVKDHWDEYCKFCETHDPLEFPIPIVEKENFNEQDIF